MNFASVGQVHHPEGHLERAIGQSTWEGVLGLDGVPLGAALDNEGVLVQYVMHFKRDEKERGEDYQERDTAAGASAIVGATRGQHQFNLLGVKVPAAVKRALTAVLTGAPPLSFPITCCTTAHICILFS